MAISNNGVDDDAIEGIKSNVTSILHNVQCQKQSSNLVIYNELIG